MAKTYMVTGGAGFIGSTLTDRLLSLGHKVVVYDNFSTGFPEFLAEAEKSPNFRLVKADLLDTAALSAAMHGVDAVFHFAANADVRFGTDHPGRDLEQNTIATFNVLEAMRANGVKKILFSSTGSIYGRSATIPTPEDAPFPVQTSLYGASKLSGEGMIAAYCEGFGFQSWIFRFVSVLGERYTHGHVFDFHRKLAADPTRLDVLGDGRQRKSYMYVQDCIDAILLAFEKANAPTNILNLGVDGYCEINNSIGWICKAMGVTPKLEYSGGAQGWIGDNPFIHLDVTRITELGWVPKLSIEEGILKTLRWLEANQWVYRRRD
jgi:UDP-glucose 4-epimerase